MKPQTDGVDRRRGSPVAVRGSTLGLLLLAACDPGDVVLASPEKSEAEGPGQVIALVP